ncbi:MAG TPA: hypothetical protein VF141_15765 [Chryseolinea sp.]
MTSKICFAFAILLVCTSIKAQDSKQTPDKIIDRIVGAWKIQKITSGKEEVAKNPTSGQWIEFRSDGTYLNNATSIDSGSYRIDENQSIVYFESAVNKDPSKNTTNMVTEWTIAFTGEGMIMQRRSTGKREHVDKMKYFYTKVGDEQKAVNN